MPPQRPAPRPGSRAPRGLALLALAAAVALAPPAGEALAQSRFGKNKIQYQTFDWHIYRSPHFDVYYYPEGEPFLQQVVSYAESAFLQLSKALDHEPKFRVPIIYYRTHAEFEQTNIDLSAIPEAVLAFAEPLEHRLVIPIDQPPDELYKVMAHEMTHIFQFSILYQDSFGRAMRGSPPLWLMEGLASHLAKDEDNLDRMIIRDAVIHGLVPPITQVRGLTFLTYRYGRAAFDFIEEKWGPEGIRTFLSEYRKVLLSGNIEKALKEAFGVEADEFDRLFKRYLRQKYLPTLLEKGEPADYGKEVGIKLPGVMTFSPVLSPSGDLIAVLTNRYSDLDVVILSAKDGEVIKNLTRGFSNEYEFVSTEVYEGKSDLTWSPDGDMVAFFVRSENRRILLIVNALTGKEVKAIDVGAANAASPAFSPDGKKILFSANLNGIVDIREVDVASGALRNITNDDYYDSNPSWSADGKTILYNRRVDAYEKIFMLDYEDPSRKTQVTFGPTSEVSPAFSRDGRRVLYSSDAGKEGIFNIYALDLETGEVRQYTDGAGGFFHPQDRPADEGRSKAVVTSYFAGRFRLYEVDTTKPLKVITPEERAADVSEMEPFEPPLNLTLDETQKRPYTKKSFHVEAAPTVGLGVASDGTFFGDAAVQWTDLLGDHRFWLYLSTVSTYQNVDAGYWNLKNRIQYYYRFQDYRDYLLVSSGPNSYERVDSNRITGVSAGAVYPISKFHRMEGSVGVFNRDLLAAEPIEFSDPATGDTYGFLTDDRDKNTNFVTGVAWVGDTLRYNSWGPWHGRRFRAAINWAPFATDSNGRFVEYAVDFRAYGKATRRSGFAFRLVGTATEGEGGTLFSIGGYNQLRGYRFREFVGDRAAIMNVEFRFPLVDDLKFPIGSIEWIRGTFFFDIGAVWTQDGYFFDREVATADILYGTSGILRDFKWYDPDLDALRDARASYGMGFNFQFGIFQLHWTFAKRLPFAEIDMNDPGCEPAINSASSFQELAAAISGCSYRKVSTSGWASDFYIGYEF